MTKITQLPPSEFDLQAYLDDELPPRARLRVVEWLLENPKSAQQIFELQLREDLLRVAVNLSLRDDDASETDTSREATAAPSDVSRYDRFTVGFAAALFVVAIVAVFMNLFA